MDETSRSSSNITALRVRVRETGLGLQGHTPKSTPHKVTFTTRHHSYDVIHALMSDWQLINTPMTSWKALMSDWQVRWPLVARWLVHLYHVTYIRLSDWSSPLTTKVQWIGTKIWNRLPLDLRSEQDINKFASGLKGHFRCKPNWASATFFLLVRCFVLFKQGSTQTPSLNWAPLTKYCLK